MSPKGSSSAAGRLIALIAEAHALEDLDAFREGIPRLLRAAVPADGPIAGLVDERSACAGPRGAREPLRRAVD